MLISQNQYVSIPAYAPSACKLAYRNNIRALANRYMGYWQFVGIRRLYGTGTHCFIFRVRLS